MDVNKLQEHLRTKHLGRNIFFTKSTDSTNNWAKKLAKLGAKDGTIAIAETQTGGHGRRGRKWISPKGGLWFSVVLRPEFKPSEMSKLVLAAGLAVAEALRDTFGLRVETKWPNDVLINGRKVCGILAETTVAGENLDYVVLGVGLNANFDANIALPRELRCGATSLKSELGRRVKLEDLFSALIERLEAVYDLLVNQAFGVILKRWKDLACFLGRQVKVESEAETLSGLALDVDVDGSLILKLDNGMLKRVYIGDVSLR